MLRFSRICFSASSTLSRASGRAGLDCGIGEQLEKRLAVGIVPFKERKLRLIRVRVGKQRLLRIGLPLAHRLHRALPEDSLLAVRGFLPAQQPGAGGLQTLSLLVRGDEHAQIVRRHALRLLRVAEQPRSRLQQRVVRLPHQQLFAVHPQIRRLQAQMIFDCGKVQLLRRGLPGNSERFPAREGALVRQHVHQRFALARPLQRNQQRLQEGVAIIRIDLRKQRQRVVHQIRLVQHARQNAQLHRQLAPVQIRGVPREDAGIEDPLFALQGGILRSEDFIDAPPLRRVGEIARGLPEPEIGLPARPLEEVRQIHRQQLRVVGPAGQRRLRQHAARVVALQGGGEEAAHQRLMAAAGLNEPHRPVDRAGRVLRRLRPQCHVNPHAVLAGEHLLAAVGALQPLQHQIERLVRNAFEIRRFARGQPRPHAHGALHRGIAQQIVVRNYPEHSPKRRKRALIGGFTDRLAQSLLQARRQQQSPQQRLQLLVPAHLNAQEHLLAHLGRALLAVQRGGQQRLEPDVAMVQLIGDELGAAAASAVPGKRQRVGRNPALKNIAQIRVDDRPAGKRAGNLAADQIHIRNIVLRAQRPPLPARGIGPLQTVIHRPEETRCFPSAPIR